MLAFLGAVICIIASVYPSSTAAAPQPLADNQSLVPDLAQRPLSPGPVAHAGPLGALHGPESLDGGGLGVGLETPAINELSSSGGVGLGKGQRFSFSRLICTPVPIGDCKSKKQADEPAPYADEEWGSFLSTAEQLRQTIQQQKEQILMDQRTIRELNGKLSECESGLEERSLQERSVGAPGNRRLMAGDDVKPSAAEHLQTAHAVDELERAILQLKDRIEKLESELGPAAHNRTEVGGKGPAHSTSSGAPGGTLEAVRWRVESLEQELEQKLAMLEKERTELHKEAYDGRHQIDEGLGDLQHRILELEQSLSEYSFPEGYKLSFPIRTNYMYAMVRRPVPELYAFSACLWLRPAEAGIGTPFSYSVVGQPNELVLLQGVHTPVELLINDKVAQLPLSLARGKWQHVCVSWSLRDGVWKAYQGGKLKGEGAGLAAWHPIRPGGVLILGQEQDTLGGRFDAAQALVGELSQFNLWDRVLMPEEVSGLADCSKVTPGNVVPWTERDIDVFGGAAREALEPCSQRAEGQQ